MRELNKDKKYHEQHKEFLVQALKWEKQQRNTSILLRGAKLENAKTWLNTAKTRTDCKPTKAHEEFIGESLAKIGQVGSEVFVSYSRNDADFARKLNNELKLYGKITWFDQENIASGADFQQEIYKGIAESDNFVFLISPSSINSPYCEDEVNFAAKQGKRIITLLIENLDSETQTKFNKLKPISEVQWLDSTKMDFYSVFMQLIRKLETDREHVEQHTKWQKKAMEAKSPLSEMSHHPEGGTSTSKTPPSGAGGLGIGLFKSELLLRGSELVLAQAWFEDAQKSKKNPRPTEMQKALILASDYARKQAEEAEKQVAENLKNRLRIAIMTAVVALFAMMIAGWFYIDANKAKKNTEIALIRADSANMASQKLINAFYFHDNKFALAYGQLEANVYENVFYFIDKEGNFIDKLGIYKEGNNFDDSGFARVLKDGETYFLDTLGNTYKLANNFSDIDTNITALDMRNEQLLKFPEKLFQYPQLKILMLNGSGDIVRGTVKIPQKIKELKKLRYLEISGFQIEQLPMELGSFNNLTDLRLSYNNLNGQSLKYISQLKNLASLNITVNELINLPAEIGQLKTLNKLYLRDNRLINLPAEIGQLKNLTTLNIDFNELTNLPTNIGQLQNLTDLTLASNKFISLGKQIGDLKNLTSLNLSSNLLTSLPAEIGQLKKIATLNVSFNELTNLPAKIGELQNLTDLTLANNFLTSLPAEIGNLKNLTSLDLSNNSLTSLPAEIVNLKNLTYLDLSTLKLISLPKEIGNLKNLTSLYLSNNTLTSLPAAIGNLKNLTSLDLSGSPLTSLPAEIGNLKNLIYLDLSTLKLTSLPKEIGQLQNLRTLLLHGSNDLDCKQTYEVISLLPQKIRFISESRDEEEGTLLVYIHPKQLFDLLLIATSEQMGDWKDLRYLDFSSTKITKLPARAEEMSNLTLLDLSNSPMSADEINKTVMKFPKLEIVYLRNLELSTLPENLLQLKNLKILGLGNRLGIENFNTFSETEQQRIRKLLPNVEIRFLD